jgi:hypothetical protein
MPSPIGRHRVIRYIYLSIIIERYMPLLPLISTRSAYRAWAPAVRREDWTHIFHGPNFSS